MTRAEKRRLRAVRFGHFMDQIDGDWQTPARLEQVVRWVYVRLPFKP